MQLTRLPGVALLLALALSGQVRAEGSVEATSTVFHEAGGPLHLTVVNPAVAARIPSGEGVALTAGWEADVVTGASVAVVDAPGATLDVDAVTSATKLKDVRHVVSGGVDLAGDTTRLSTGYAYGFERDYRSHGLRVRAAAELFDRNTTLEVGYGRGWDRACDLLQPSAEQAAERQRLPSSDGCFASGRGRTARAIDLHTFDGAWTQAWSPIFNTQWSLSTQLVTGFQSNPYRAVWLGRSAAQEHHPRQRARHGTTLAARVWLRPLGGALQLEASLYRDSWDVRAVSGELAYERGFGTLLRVRLRGRHYRQTGAAFYSDDYGRAPRGQYFTGDRELSPMASWLAGARVELAPLSAGEGSAGGLLDGLRVVLKADALLHDFGSFHYGTAGVPNRRSLLATLGIDARF